MAKSHKKTHVVSSLRKSMSRRDDYMSMRLPRSFANTVEQLLTEDPSLNNSESENANKLLHRSAKKRAR